MERPLGEPAHDAVLLVVDDDRLGAQPASVGDADEQCEQQAREATGEGDPADHLGDDRDDLRRAHASNGSAASAEDRRWADGHAVNAVSVALGSTVAGVRDP